MTRRGGPTRPRPRAPDGWATRLQHDRVEVVPLADVPRTHDGRVDLVAATAALGGPLFESAPQLPGTGRYSHVVADTAGRLVHRAGRTHLALADRTTVDLDADAFAALDAVADALGCRPDRPREAAAFAGGLAGAFAYDLGRLVERVPERAVDDRGGAWLDLVLPTAVVVVDHTDESAHLIRRPLPRIAPAASVDAVAARLARAVTVPAAAASPSRRATSTFTRSEYLTAVRRVLDHIAAGNVFQVNLTQRLSVPWHEDALALYAALRRHSPAPHAAFHRCGDGTAVVSVSPETFLRVTGREVVTRPIKGTRPRASDPQVDARQRDELVASEKDRAENVMVVDMERNDLGRVCEPHSVHAQSLLEPEAHPTVWQLVSTVTGRLRDGVGYGELLAATFPSGSVTGTPKVRAMQIIDELEPVRRGWYCGALGMLGPGWASLSVGIRTATVAGGVADYGAGGGIVADSDPEQEYEESLVKARAFLAATAAEVQP